MSEEKAKEERQEFDLNTAEELHSFLTNVRDKLADDTAAPVYAMGVLNTILEHPSVYTLMTAENKELARDIWLRLKQAGFQVKNPPMLFDGEDDVSPAASR